MFPHQPLHHTLRGGRWLTGLQKAAVFSKVVPWLVYINKFFPLKIMKSFLTWFHKTLIPSKCTNSLVTWATPRSNTNLIDDWWKELVLKALCSVVLLDPVSNWWKFISNLLYEFFYEIIIFYTNCGISFLCQHNFW